MEIEQITASRIVANLETLGWARRRIDDDDRRRRLVYLTEAALPALEAISQLGITTEEEMLSALTPDERAVFSAFVGRIHNRMTELVRVNEADGTLAEKLS